VKITGNHSRVHSAQFDLINIAFTSPRHDPPEGHEGSEEGRMSARLLIADSDPVQRRHLEATVNRLGYTAETVTTALEVRERLLGGAGMRAPTIDLLILDLASTDGGATELLAALEEDPRRIPTIVQAAPGAIEEIQPSIRAGARDFIVKPVGAQRLEVSLENVLHTAALEKEVARLGREAAGSSTFAELGGASEAMQRVARLGTKAAKTKLAVLLEGEAGTGKEVVARAIHGASERRGRAFVSVNCRALPPIEAWPILFGQGRGPLGEAEAKQAGKVREAEGGTLFLDEVGSLPPGIQVALLRALQTGEIEPSGARRPLEVDVRFIVATTQNLIELVTRGLFREDLFYRLSVASIAIPPLRARREDTGELARRFCARFAAELGKNVRGIGAEALHLLERYDWPGNVRELENALFRAVALAEGDELGVAEFPQIAALAGHIRIAPPPVAVPPVRAKEFVTVEVRDPNVLALLDESGRMHRLDRLEKEAIRFALGHYHGQISAVARGLGIGRSTLYRKMKDYGLAPGNVDLPGSAEPEAGDRLDGAAA
jgi:DNA-binding NtrC family response regulator